MVESQVPRTFEELKQRGNESFASGRYAEAIDLYTKGLDLNPRSAILYANRSASQLKLENYGLAEQDATKAIECDPNYIKGYYRRGSAHFSMGKFKDAINDLKTVCQRFPNDKDAKQKFEAAKKEYKAIQ